MTKRTLILPLNAIGRPDIYRLVRELAEIDDFLSQAAIRKAGTKLNLPRLSATMEDLVVKNHANLLKKEDRALLSTELNRVQHEAPVVNMSFASEPSNIFTQKIIRWLREEIAPETLLQIGLQPTIAAGCIVRTPNHYFDFSLRKHFTDQREKLAEQIKKVSAS